MKANTKGLTVLSGLVLIGILMTSGCPQQGPTLVGPVWNLESYVNSGGKMVNVLANTAITAQFQNGIVSGSSGCNTYSGSYQINNKAITISNVTQTLMECTTPAGIMDQENDYHAALMSVTSYEIIGSKLEMANATGTVVLIFT